MQTLYSNSSAIEQARHDGDTLFVTFRDGVEVAYDGVPAILFHRMTRAGSHGRFFNEFIRGQFPVR